MRLTDGGWARPLAAEALGACLLVATVIGSGIMADRLAGGNDAVALLGNTLATAAMLVVLITTLGPVSGAHFNPAVSLLARLDGRLTNGGLAAYLGAQVAGGVAGAVLAHAMFELPLIQASTTVRAGPAQWLSEAVATFALVFAIWGTLRTRPEAVAWSVGLVIAAGYWWTASTSFANPGVAIARAFTDTFAGIRPEDVAPFVAAQLIGALAGWASVRLLFGAAATAGDAANCRSAPLRPAS